MELSNSNPLLKLPLMTKLFRTTYIGDNTCSKRLKFILLKEPVDVAEPLMELSNSNPLLKLPLIFEKTYIITFYQNVNLNHFNILLESVGPKANSTKFCCR